MRRLTIREMHKLLRAGKARLRPLSHVERKTRKGYNKNYIRDWFDFGSKR